MKVFSLINFLVFLAVATFAQTTDKVSQLIANENYFAALVKEKGVKKAFQKVSDKNTVVFRPQPVNALEYFKEQPDSLGYLSWEPEFARIAKSNDWGFTTGPFVFKKAIDGKAEYYGTYVSVWKKNSKGVWKLALDLGVSHKKPTKRPDLDFENPESEKFLHQLSKSRLEQREDIVLSSDRLLSSIEKANNKVAMVEFVAENCRYIIPDYEPIIGKSAILNFWDKHGFRESSTPLTVDRAYSGEFAFTQGDATIYSKAGPKKYHYIRIWEVQPGYKWNIILQIYSEAGEEKKKADD